MSIDMKAVAIAGEPYKIGDVIDNPLHLAFGIIEAYEAAKASEQPVGMSLEHGMNCSGMIPGRDHECTCGLKWRIMLQTEQTMHNAWRKRAEEAEAALATRERELLDPDMPAQKLRLHMGELSAEEVRVARAAIAWANTRYRS